MYCGLTLYRVGKRPGFGGKGAFAKRSKFGPSTNQEEDESTKPAIGQNNFANDGSFLEQFKKLQGGKGMSVEFISRISTNMSCNFGLI